MSICLHTLQRRWLQSPTAVSQCMHFRLHPLTMHGTQELQPGDCLPDTIHGMQELCPLIRLTGTWAYQPILPPSIACKTSIP